MRKHLFIVALVIILLVVAVGCSKEKKRAPVAREETNPLLPDEEESPDKEKSEQPAQGDLLLEEGFEAGNIQAVLDNGIGFAAVGPEAVDIVSSPVRSGKYALRLTVKPEDIASKKNRAELKYEIPKEIEKSSEMWYSWSFMIPEDFIDLPPDSDAFNMIAQWLDTSVSLDADSTAGPPINMRYGTNEGQSGISLIYGLRAGSSRENRKIIGQTTINKGEWVDVRAHVKRSEGQEGFIEVWVNGKSLTKGKVYGPNVYDFEAKHVFKVGLYRGAVGQAKTTNSIYIDNLRVEASSESAP